MYFFIQKLTILKLIVKINEYKYIICVYNKIKFCTVIFVIKPLLICIEAVQSCAKLSYNIYIIDNTNKLCLLHLHRKDKLSFSLFLSLAYILIYLEPSD